MVVEVSPEAARAKMLGSQLGPTEEALMASRGQGNADAWQAAFKHWNQLNAAYMAAVDELKALGMDEP